MCLCSLFDCCGLICRRGIYLPSFAERMSRIDHSYDEALLGCFKQLQFSKEALPYNPAPSEERAAFRELGGNMFEKNYLLRSRIFIHNAKALQLNTLFDKKTPIRILDLGCGTAPTLMGILTYFGLDRVEYLGVDNNAKRMAESATTYKNFAKVKFVDQDGLKFLQDGSYKDHFDVVLIQHPNIESPFARETFARLFKDAANVLAPGGVIYSTFYYTHEIEFFKKEVLPTMGRMQGSIRLNRDFFIGFLQNRHTGDYYIPENYCFLSGKKAGSQEIAQNMMVKKMR